jgi:pyruvate/2-oxoglutarate dehydrogenase complex dihydrolipoamide dehydrogenase (E3) component
MATFFLATDTFDRKLVQDIFPGDWKNPAPAGLYDLVIVGGGPAGMTAATIAARLKARVAVVEKEHFGGECLSVGCIPSKALLRSSRVAAAVRDAADYGIDVAAGEWRTNFPAVMERVRRLRTVISPEDSAAHFRHLGADIFLGTGRFTGRDTLEVAGQTLHFRKAIIAAGTEPARLSVHGLEEAGYLTNQTVFNLTALPPRLAVIGAGGIGGELAQAFARFGSRVTLVTDGARILPREDPDAAERLHGVMKKDGIAIWTGCRVSRVERQGDAKVLHADGAPDVLVADEILVGVGREPAVESYGLEEAGVAFDRNKGITADDHLRTGNPNVYAIPSRYNLTHVVKELATIAVQNALADGQATSSALTIPWCTYTDPEIAQVGISEEEARARGTAVRTVKVELAEVGRAILDGQTDGFVKMHVREESGELLGATIVAAHAGEMLSELTVAMVAGVGLSPVARAIHPFPTQAEAIRAAAQAALH